MKVLAVAATVGVAVVALAWWIGPGLFGAPHSPPEQRVVTATVTEPMSCTTAGATEKVRFSLDGQTRKGVLTACGHDKEEKVEVVVPADAGSGSIEVRSAVSSPGYSTLRGPLGLLLLALSCGAGGTYAFLVIRGPRREPALA